jgi:PucR family transcriptional regulator, purine catabolism regulatory protein
MEKVANDVALRSRELPVASANVAPERSAGSPMTVARMLTLPALAGAEVVAGARGLDRVVRRANVMEVPDIVSWVRPEGVLLTTGYPLRESTADLASLVTQLDEHGVSALAVKLHRYLDALPEPMLREADRCGLPLVVVPDSVGFDEVLTEVFTSVASERASLLERRDDVHRQLVNAVLAGGGLTEVVGTVSALFGGPAMVTTVDGRVLSDVSTPEQRALLNASSVFHPSGRFRAEAFTPGVHVVGDLPGSHAVAAVSGGRVDHGRLVVFDAEHRLTGEDLAVLERAADVAAICLTKELAVTAVESKYRGDFLRDVLAGRAGEPGDIQAHAASLGWDLDRPLVVVVAALETESAPPMSRGYQGPLELERFSAAWSTVVTRKDPSIPVVGFAAEVVALLPLPDPTRQHDVVEQTIRGVRGDGGGGRRPFAAGVSRVVAQVGELPTAYEQARKAHYAGRRLHGPTAITHFDDLGVFRLLSLIGDEAELDRFVAETLKELSARTGEEAATLRETLQVLLDTNLNVAETARRLHFHYNTLRYRIAKIEGLVGPFTTDPNLRLDLALALRILVMKNM